MRARYSVGKEALAFLEKRDAPIGTREKFCAAYHSRRIPRITRMPRANDDGVPSIVPQRNSDDAAVRGDEIR